MTTEILLNRVANILEMEYLKVEQTPYITLLRLMVEENERLLIENDKLFKTNGVNNEGGNVFRLNDYCKEAFSTALLKGWHDESREFGTYIALMHSELSEALEADRRGEGLDRTVEELADVCIRIFDWCGLQGVDFERVVIEKMLKNKGREYKHGGKKY